MLAALKALPGQKSLLVTRMAVQTSTDVAALDSDALLAAYRAAVSSQAR